MYYVQILLFHQSFTYYCIFTDILNEACVFCSFPDEELVFKYAPWALNKSEVFAATVSKKCKLYMYNCVIINESLGQEEAVTTNLVIY